MGDSAAYLRDTLREREAELTRTIQLVADLKATVIELADALEQCTHRSAELRAALTTEQQARDHDAVAADNALAEKDAQIREWETGAVAASTEIVRLRQQIVALTEKADYFRESRDKNGEALDRVRAAADSLAKAIHVALAHGDRTTLGTVRGGLADAVNALSTLTLHVCGGTQARICPVTKQPHDMSAVVRFADGGSVACKDCGATAMDMDLLEMP